VDDAVEQRRRVVGAERTDAGRHFEQHHAEGVEVGPRIHGTAFDLLGGHVGQRAAALQVGGARGPCILAGKRDETGEAEVEHLGPAARRDDHVARLQIPVHDALFVRGLEGLGNFQGDGTGARFRQGACRENRCQRLAGHELEDEEVHVVFGVQIEQRGDVGVEESRESARLQAEAPSCHLVVDRVLAQDFERHLALESRILGAIHLTHAPAPEPLDQAIAPQRSAHWVFSEAVPIHAPRVARIQSYASSAPRAPARRSGVGSLTGVQAGLPGPL
jgi:hypothetical protein